MSHTLVTIRILLLTLGVFTFFRAILLVAYFDEFSALSLFEILQSFVHGLRFDFALASILLSIPLLMIHFPLKWTENKQWLKFWYWVCFPIVLAACLLLAADIAYYAFVKRHITQELRLILHDSLFILQMGLSSYKLAILSFLAFSVGLAFLWKKALPINSVADNPGNLGKRLAIFTLVFFVLVIGIRGGTQRKTIHVVNAFSSGNAIQGNLTLNGAYSSLRSFNAKPSVSHHFYEEEQLKKQAHDIGLYQHSDSYPFQKKFTHGEEKKLNIIIVLLESWSYRYIDALAGNNYGVTPNFDKIIKQGLSFNRFYANGQRSIEGLQAVLTGVPNLIDMPRLGWGLENSKFTRLGSLLKKHDYHTVFTQSSRRTSFHIDGISAATGFEHYFGMEDMELKLNYSDPHSFWFGWDHETFNKVINHLSTVNKPFINFTFTGTTHAPYGTLPIEFKKFPHGKNSENGFLNTLYYSDWALGQFMQQAKQQPWFDDTIFFFTADHTLGHFHKKTTLERFHIPLVIYSPKYIKAGVNNVIGCHLDIMPTIIDLLQLSDTYSALGASLLRKKNNNNAFAYLHAGNITGIVNNEGYLMHTLKKITEAKTLKHRELDNSIKDKLERTLLTIDQTAFQAVQSNNWQE